MKSQIWIGVLASVLAIAIVGGLVAFLSAPQPVIQPQPAPQPVPPAPPQPVQPPEPVIQQPPPLPPQPPVGGIGDDAKRATEIAKDFIVKAPTFKFDGITETLKVTDGKTLESFPPQYVLTMTFDSRHSGYGDRAGRVLAQVITKHTVVIKVVAEKVTSAIIDDQWDELTQQMLGGTIFLTEGQRDGPLLVQKIYPDYITGLSFIEYPVARLEGFPVTLRIGDSVSNGCTVTLTLLRIQDKTAIFSKRENMNRPCPICLSENTMIDTPNGPINVKELKVGMLVWTSDLSGQKRSAVILKTAKTEVTSAHNMIHLVLDDGRELFASMGHPTADGRILSDLRAGGNIGNARVKIAEMVTYEATTTYDILPSGETGFYWANGILIGSTLTR